MIAYCMYYDDGSVSEGHFASDRDAVGHYKAALVTRGDADAEDCIEVGSWMHGSEDNEGTPCVCRNFNAHGSMIGILSRKLED